MSLCSASVRRIFKLSIEPGRNVVATYLSRSIFDEHRKVAVVCITRGDAGGNSVGGTRQAALGAQRERVYIGVGITLLAAMVMALVFAARRGTARRPVAIPVAEPQSRSLVRAIAALDAAPNRDGHRGGKPATMLAWHRSRRVA